jgi:hypothetical protein
MEQIIQWLLDDDQKELFEILVALALNILFLALIGLLLWPLGKLMLVFDLAKGYGLLWLVTFVTAMLLNGIQRFFRMDMYHHANTYLFSTLAVSCLLQGGWAAFAARTIHDFVTGEPVWIGVILYVVGVVSCLIAFSAVSSIYYGTIYKLISFAVILVGFLVFSVWPASGGVVYGWFFQLF